MKKQNYEAIAKIIKGVRELPFNYDEDCNIDKITQGLCNYFKEDNQRFNMDKFLKKCL